MIYLDYSATTPLDKRVSDLMNQVNLARLGGIQDPMGNPGIHGSARANTDILYHGPGDTLTYYYDNCSF